MLTALSMEAHGQTLAPLTAAGQSFTGYFVEFDGKEWLLIGRGREGWEFDTDGQGSVDAVSQNVGTSGAFAPACYSDAIINDLLNQAGITDMANLEVRLARASNPGGTGVYQDVRWTNFTGNGGNFTWNLEDSRYGVTIEYKNAPYGLSGAATGIHPGRDTRDANISNNAMRIFTWAWGGHGNQKGFSYGNSVSNGSNLATSFLWEYGNENHAIPYTEVYIPYISNDDQPPSIDSLNPADNATGTYIGADLVATFDERIALRDGGTITITDLTDGSDTRTITLPNAQVSVSARDLIINLSTNLEVSTQYEVTINSLAIQDTYSTPNAYGGTASGEWTFTTADPDPTAPVITNLSPADNSTGVTNNADDLSLVATFDDNILFGASGNITLVDLATPANNRVIPIGDPRLSITDNRLTITLASDLEMSVEYALQIDAGALINYSAVPFAGISNTTTWSFTTRAGQDGAWTLNNNGQWFDTNNWSGGLIAGGTVANAGGTADFSTIDINNHRTITITGAPAVIGSLILGDSNSSHDYRFSNGTGGSLVFDGPGDTAYLTDTSMRNQLFNHGFVVNDQLEIDVATTGGLDVRGAISGTGGITVKGGRLQLRVGSTDTYSGPTIIDGGAEIMWQNGSGFTNESTNSNIILKDGIYNRYYDSNLTIPLGTGARQIQILGGTSGFSGNRNFNVTLNNSGATIVWGSTYFNPEKLVLTSSWANTYGRTILHNRIDLNGQSRTISILCNSSNDTGYGNISYPIVDNAASGTGIIKEGQGALLLDKANTFTGPVQIHEGLVRVTHAAGLGTQADGGLMFTEGGTTLDMRTSLTIGELSSTDIYFGTVTNGGTSILTLTVDQDSDSTYAGVIDDGYTGGQTGITKTGTGTLTFPFDEEIGYGVGSYHSGPTLVNEGAVIMDADWDAAYSDVTVAAGASFGGKGQMAGNLTLTDGAKLFFDPAETLTCNGFSVDLGNLSVAKLVLHGAATVPDDTYLVITGSATIDTSTVENLGAENAGTFDGKYGYFNINTDGDLELVVSATDPADTSSYAGWKSFHGLSGSSANDDADDDGDGIPLLLEYALGGDPGVASRGILPTRQYTDDAGNTYLELVVTRPIGLTGVNYIVQTDTTLSSWPVDSTGVILFSTTDLGNGTETLVYRRAAAVSTSARAFIRLKVTAN